MESRNLKISWKATSPISNHPIFQPLSFPSPFPHTLTQTLHPSASMAVHAAAVISAATKIAFSSAEISHQQIAFLSHSSHSSLLKFTAANAQCDKRRFITAKATKSESGVNPKVGVAVYKPRSYQVLVSDAANSLFSALQDGKTRMEIDFPCVTLLNCAFILLCSYN